MLSFWQHCYSTNRADRVFMLCFLHRNMKFFTCSALNMSDSLNIIGVIKRNGMLSLRIDSSNT